VLASRLVGQLHAGGHAEFGVDVREVGLHGPRSDEKPGGNVLIAQSLTDQPTARAGRAGCFATRPNTHLAANRGLGRSANSLPTVTVMSGGPSHDVFRLLGRVSRSSLAGQPSAMLTGGCTLLFARVCRDHSVHSHGTLVGTTGRVRISPRTPGTPAIASRGQYFSPYPAQNLKL
jgi:hypothetical protein